MFQVSHLAAVARHRGPVLGVVVRVGTPGARRGGAAPVNSPGVGCTRERECVGRQEGEGNGENSSARGKRREPNSLRFYGHWVPLWLVTCQSF